MDAHWHSDAEIFKAAWKYIDAHDAFCQAEARRREQALRDQRKRGDLSEVVPPRRKNMGLEDASGRRSIINLDILYMLDKGLIKRNLRMRGRFYRLTVKGKEYQMARSSERKNSK
jgi:hypothetical protein